MKPCPSPFAPSQTSSFSFSRPIPAIRRFISNVLVDFIPRASGHTTGRSPSTYRMACSGSGSGRARVGAHYRALAIDVPDGMLWFWIGTRADYDRVVA